MTVKSVLHRGEAVAAHTYIATIPSGNALHHVTVDTSVQEQEDSNTHTVYP